MNAEVGKYKGLCESLARDLCKPGTRGTNGVEYDDLVQEGLLNVWQTLQRGIKPDAKLIRERMKNYVRWLGQKKRNPVAYGQMLPLEDYRNLPSA